MPSKSVLVTNPSVKPVADVRESSPGRGCHLMRVDMTVPEVCSEETPRPTRMMMSVGAIPCEKARSGLGTNLESGNMFTYIDLDGHDGEDPFCRVLDGKEHGEDQLE